MSRSRLKTESKPLVILEAPRDVVRLRNRSALMMRLSEFDLSTATQNGGLQEAVPPTSLLATMIPHLLLRRMIRPWWSGTNANDSA